jgi:tRNA (guanine37-N1)-methyltransferase
VKPAIDILTLFPDVVRTVLDASILRRAQVQGHMDLLATDLRSFTVDKYRSVDDSPFGGKQGMLFTAPILERALEAQLAQAGERSKLKVLYTSPRGIRLEQPVLDALAGWLGSGEGHRLAVVCGRYEGVDERFVERWVDLEYSVGDFILTGGEIPALTLVDGIVRLMPGVLGHEQSAREDSFSNGLLEYPQYTKPREFMGRSVPAELLSGNHADIERWHLRQSLLMTFAFRPDLIKAHHGQGLPEWARELLEMLKTRLDLRT